MNRTLVIAKATIIALLGLVVFLTVANRPRLNVTTISPAAVLVPATTSPGGITTVAVTPPTTVGAIPTPTTAPPTTVTVTTTAPPTTAPPTTVAPTPTYNGQPCTGCLPGNGATNSYNGQPCTTATCMVGNGQPSGVGTNAPNGTANGTPITRTDPIVTAVYPSGNCGTTGQIEATDEHLQIIPSNECIGGTVDNIGGN